MNRMMNKMELETHECLQYWLPQIAVSLQEIAKAAKFEMEEKKMDKEFEKKKIAKELSKLSKLKNLTPNEIVKELRGEN